jgi:PAS domain S-box-containing protein
MSPSAPPDLDTVLDSTTAGVFVIDRERRVVVLNAACERLTGCSREKVVSGGQGCDVVFGCRLGDLATCPADAVFDLEATVRHRRVRIDDPDSGSRWLEVSYTPLTNSLGTVDYVVGLVRDVSKAVRTERRLRRRASRMEQEIADLRHLLVQEFGFGHILSRSPLMEKVFAQIRAACASPSTVLVCGESGTGKELVARAIHDHGANRDGPFVAVNCAALPADLIENELFGHVRGSFTGATSDSVGLFRAADGGTLFLDEIAEMPVGTQAKLLRVLQEGVIRPVGGTREVAVRVRVVAATNRDPEDALRSGSLREDLYYRLSVITIALPPLRRRPEDIPLLAQHFLEEQAPEAERRLRGFTEEAAAALTRYEWPGNVRELQNAIARACAMGSSESIRLEDLPARVTVEGRGSEIVVPLHGGDVPPLRATLRNVEKELIERALAATAGNKSRAADLLGIQRKHLYRKIEEYAIRLPPSR